MMNEDRIKKLEDEIRLLRMEIDGLKNPASINPDIVDAVWQGQTPAIISGKSATSENKSVNEAGVSTYSVLNPPDRFILIGGQNVPAYD